MIIKVHSELIPFIPQRDHTLFLRSKTEVLALPHQSQVAWLGRVKFLYPEEYKSVERQYAGAARPQEENISRYITQLDTNIR